MIAVRHEARLVEPRVDLNTIEVHIRMIRSETLELVRHGTACSRSQRPGVDKTATVGAPDLDSRGFDDGYNHAPAGDDNATAGDDDGGD